VPESAALSLPLADAAATDALATRLAPLLAAAATERGLVVYLEGGLGAGKTTLVRGLLRALGHTGRVPSPTYTLVEPYEIAGFQVIHADLYRLTAPADCDDLGLRESLAAVSLALIEWPDRGGDRLPPPDLVLTLDLAAEGRQAYLTGRSPRGAGLIARLAAGTSRSRT
jgi:tRNA threonylcarbamoyladenosine biosynthesis protein TsaE